MKKKISIILFILGLIPFIILFIGGIYASIEGYSPVFMSYLHHGFDAFVYFSQDWLGVFWPVYLVGIILIVISMIMKRGK